MVMKYEGEIVNTVPSYLKGAPYIYIQCCSNLGQFLIGMHCFNTGSLCYLSVDVFENWIYFFIIYIMIFQKMS